MSMATKIKGFQVFVNGKACPRMVKKVKIPKLAYKTEEYYADVMSGPIEIFLGKEKMESTITWESFPDYVLTEFGICTHNGTRLRLMASMESEECDFDELEIVMNGRWKELDMGDAENGSDTNMDTPLAISEYAYIKNGKELIYSNHLTGVERRGGMDITLPRRKAMGMEF